MLSHRLALPGGLPRTGEKGKGLRVGIGGETTESLDMLENDLLVGIRDTMGHKVEDGIDGAMLEPPGLS